MDTGIRIAATITAALAQIVLELIVLFVLE
jgi:hypothetical protein